MTVGAPGLQELVQEFGLPGGLLLGGAAGLYRLGQYLLGLRAPSGPVQDPPWVAEIRELRADVVELRARLDAVEQREREVAAGLARIEGQLVGLGGLSDLLRHALHPPTGGRRG